MIKVLLNIFISLLIFSINSYSEGKYISKFITQESERDHGGLDEVYLLGSYVVWQGEDSSGDNQVYLFKGSGDKIEITKPDGSSFSSANLSHAADNYIAIGSYLFDIEAETTAKPSYEGSYSQNHTISASNVFYSAFNPISSKHEFYKYDIYTDLHEKLSLDSSDYAISSSSGRAHYNGKVVWREELSDGSKYWYYYDGTSTTEITNRTSGLFYGFGLSENNIAFSDGNIVSITNFTDETWVHTDIESLAASDGGTDIDGISNNFWNTMADNGYVLELDFNWDGRYKGLSAYPGSDKQIYFLEGFTNLITVSDYRYDESGVVKLDSPWMDGTISSPLSAIAQESYAPHADGIGYLPERWVSHDLDPSAGNGIIAYHAYNSYADYGPLSHIEDIFVYDINEQKHYGVYLDDSDRLGYYGSLEWAVCDRNNRNVAFTLVDPWATIYDDVGVAYWVGPDAYLVDVDLSGEDLSEIDFSGADLTGADLTGADLTGADLSSAILSDVTFTSATYDDSTVMPMSFIPSEYEMISLSEPTPITSIIEMSLDGISYSNSTSNIWFGLEYTTDLASGEWSDTEASGVMYWENNTTGFFPLAFQDVEMSELFMRSVISTNPIGDWMDYTEDVAKIASADFIDLDKIGHISRFRSGKGHDYPDGYEECRSMKHYYYAYDDFVGEDVNIYSPVDGVITDLTEEGERGTRIMIKPNGYDAYKVIIFHVDTNSSVTNGASLTAGDVLGTIFVSEDDDNVSTDIAVQMSLIDGIDAKQKMVSYFDIMSDAVYSNYVERGVTDKSDVIISKLERDADPLTCEGQTFTGPSNTIGNVVHPANGYSAWNNYGNTTNVFIFDTP